MELGVKIHNSNEDTDSYRLLSTANECSDEQKIVNSKIL
jgi:hypothetical protein